MGILGRHDESDMYRSEERDSWLDTLWKWSVWKKGHPKRQDHYNVRFVGPDGNYEYATEYWNGGWVNSSQNITGWRELCPELNREVCDWTPELLKAAEAGKR